MGRVFLAYGAPLPEVPSLKYLGRKLSSSKDDWTEPMAGAGKVGMNGEYFGEGGSGQEKGGDILCGRGAIGASVWVIDIGNDPQSGEGPRGFPPPGGTADGGHGTQMSMGWDMGVPTHWGSAGNGECGCYQGLYYPLLEHGRTQVVNSLLGVPFISTKEEQELQELR